MKRLGKVLLALSMFIMAGCSSGGTPSASASGSAESTAGQSTDGAPEDETADVVIVGAGITGLMAAEEFATNYPELKVVILEELSFAGGSGLLSDGVVLGFTDKTGQDLTQLASPDQYEALFAKSSKIAEDYGFVEKGYQSNADLVTNVYSNIGEVVDRVQSYGANIHYEDLPLYNENSYDDDILALPAEGGGSGLLSAVIDDLNSKSADIRLNSKVTELLAEGNKVSGVTVETEQGTYTIHSNYVVLATGGTGNNPDILAEYNPNFANVHMYSNAGANGDSITFTRQFNTPLIGDGVLGLISSDDDTYMLMGSNFMVGMDGHRFANETLNTYLLLLALQNLAGGEAYVLCDDAYYQAHKEEVDYKLNAGTVTKYDSLEDFCAASGVDEEGLKEEIASYNAAYEAGSDSEFQLAHDAMHPIGNGPYYAEKASTYCFGTIKSIQINEKLQVLNGDLEPVEGLYAGGEATLGNIFNAQYSKSGACLSYGMTSGTQIAKEIGAELTK
jgi:fumarate reductase flavoprotein subunit